MPTISIAEILNIAGISLSANFSRTGGGQEGHEISLPAAKAGVLTTRTDDNTGVITSNAHGLTDSNKVAVFWTGGKRVGMDITAYDTNTITVDAGAGDNFPIAPPAIVLVALETSLTTVAFDGDDMMILAVGCDQRGAVNFLDTGSASLLVLEICAANELYRWCSSQGVARPITGNAVVTTKWYNAGLAAATFKIGVLLVT